MESFLRPAGVRLVFLLLYHRRRRLSRKGGKVFGTARAYDRGGFFAGKGVRGTWAVSFSAPENFPFRKKLQPVLEKLAFICYTVGK